MRPRIGLRDFFVEGRQCTFDPSRVLGNERNDLCMNFTVNLIFCGLLLAITLGVALYRKWLEDHCDHYIHLHNDSHDNGVINTQQDLCRRLEMMGKLQTYLIAATIAYAVIIAAMGIYSAWITAGNPT